MIRRIKDFTIHGWNDDGTECTIVLYSNPELAAEFSMEHTDFMDTIMTCTFAVKYIEYNNFTISENDDNDLHRAINNLLTACE